ncbi:MULTISPECIES: response regulator [Tenacibaculum]|uniref:response regulator n=1 Tax=Tenacibaculum TaxID=104267 RepID=UPI0017F8E039|nr:response regulator [Tenacibaculum sp.]NVK09508.1 response regulator [Tenacibaculum sp.]
MKKLHTILLIDDDPATNFLHKLIIEKENCTEHVVCKQSAEDALVYLKSKVDDKSPHPELIFLDINMPKMNGWDFLEEYKKFDKNRQAKKIVIMLTTSLDPNDREKAKSINQINEFQSKPLTSEKLKSILASNFPTKFNHS